MRGGNGGSLWPQGGGWSCWLPHGGCWSYWEFHEGGPWSEPPGPLHGPLSRGGPPLQEPWSRPSFHMPSWLLQGGHGGGGWLGSKGGWREAGRVG